MSTKFNFYEFLYNILLELEAIFEERTLRMGSCCITTNGGPDLVINMLMVEMVRYSGGGNIVEFYYSSRYPSANDDGDVKI